MWNGRNLIPTLCCRYSTEISFGWLDRNVEGMGEQLLTDITRPRLGHFTYDLLDEQSFLLGEEIASAGAWGQPEPWGRWLCHSHGEIVFALADDPSQVLLCVLATSGLSVDDGSGGPGAS